ncbi:MAG: hypothetical protein KJ767_01570 [Nanoarchaeota archaeon]|nr:hypothetical protein [Nanoarchaeota archaeon]
MVVKSKKGETEKLILTGLSNWQDETYIRLHVGKNSTKALFVLDCFLSDLGITYRIFKECLESKNKTCNYKEFVTNHYFFKNKKYKIHLIFGERNIHLIVRTPKSRTHEMLSILKDYVKSMKEAKKM